MSKPVEQIIPKRHDESRKGRRMHKNQATGAKGDALMQKAFLKRNMSLFIGYETPRPYARDEICKRS